MANTPGPRLRAEGIAIDAAYPNQLVVHKGAQQRFARRGKAVFAALPVFRQAAQHIEMLFKAFGAQRREPRGIRRRGGN